MKAMTIQTQISADGQLRLELPCGLPPGPAEVVVVVQSAAAKAPEGYRSLSGLLAGRVPPEADVETLLREIRAESARASVQLPL
jgi:hypothetical protein